MLEADNFPLGTAGAPIVLNRRGTRFYRRSPDGLAVVYARTNRIIKNVTFPNGSMVRALSPDFRYLWGIGLEKEVVVVIDEKKARLVKTLDLAGRQGSFCRRSRRLGKCGQDRPAGRAPEDRLCQT